MIGHLACIHTHHIYILEYILILKYMPRYIHTYMDICTSIPNVTVLEYTYARQQNDDH